MESIVISFGGSVVLSEEVDIIFFNKFLDLLNKLSTRYKIFLVIGGGRYARNYINLGRTLGFDEKFLDEIGIELTRINAKILTNIFKISNDKIPKSTDEAKDMLYKIVIMGGTTPGHSTDMVAAELAEKAKAEKLIIATNVNGVYDKDPNIHSDAKHIKEISIKDLIDKYGTKWEKAGKKIVIDGPCLEIIQRAKIPTLVLNGKKLDELEKAVNNQEFNGTIITK